MRRWWVTALSVALLGAAVGLLASAPDNLIPDAQRPTTIPWWVLAPAYLATALVPVVYESRGEIRTFSLTQFAVGAGLVFVAPWNHLLARVTAGLAFCALPRRQPLEKSLFNLAAGALEVSVAVAVSKAVAIALPFVDAGPRLWFALLAGLVVSEIASFVALQLVFLVVGSRLPLRRMGVDLAALVGSTAVFAGVAVVVVAAVWTDVWTAVVGAVVAGALAVLYRNHRRLASDQKKTTELHQFTKGLGPLDLDDPERRAVLRAARVFLNASHLDLALQSDEGWQHYVDDDEEGEPSLPAPDPSTRVGSAHLDEGHHMSAPLLGSQELVGVLRVSTRLGKTRPFGLRDLRLLETLAVEFAAALERGRLQKQLALAATTDALTHLPNLHETSLRLVDMLDTEPSGVLVSALAVDSFREVNDTLGHQVGDDLLREVTRRLQLSYPGALIGRIGGGRFAVAVPADVLGSDPAMFGLGLRTHVEGGAQLGPVGTHIKLSVGCVRGPEHGGDAATLIRRAETAMYSARHASGGPVVWEPAYEVEGQRRLAVVMALREALASGAIGVGFQPKVDALTRQVTGVEALARWTHPALGAISPLEFVPLAEAAGLMGPLTSTVLRQSLTTCKGWQRRGGRIGVAVNVSAETILDPSFVTDVAANLTATGMDPDLLTLELTEGVVVDDPMLAAVRMSELRALGVKISVDDFGTGYSSLTYLKGLPVDEVKIDKGFVDGIAHDGADRAVVRAVVDIAHTLGLRVVAEGVEQEEQHVLLAQLGVDEVQGFLHARPMPALDMAQWLRRREQSAQA
jgi:diguanylate cyclase (GGDEF)-like protein